MTSAPPGLGPATWWSRVWPFALVALAYAVVAAQQITLPGVYMDAVNPDYLAAGVLNRRAESIAAWLLPGNYLRNRFPVLPAFYHGTQQLWLGLPFFWLFGTTVTGLRLTHALFALGVLAALYAYLVRSGMKPWQCALACGALALDPSFSYAFRTQSYITLAPAAWLFLSLYALARSAAPGERESRWLFASGLCYGFSVVGYFVYAFFLPALLLALRWYRREPWPRGTLVALAAGFALGMSGYALGYALLILDRGSLANAWDYFQQTQREIQAFSGQADFATRIAYLAANIDSVFRNWYHHSLIFGEQEDTPGGAFKTALLIGGPLLLFARAQWRRSVPVALRTVLALAVSFAAVSLIFGPRLSGHHYMVLLPLSYAALALGLSLVAPPAWRSAKLAVVLPFAVLVALNVGGQIREGLRLAQTRGVGLYSDAINRLAADLDAANPRPFAYFPDWGLSMPVAFLTRGRVGLDTVEDFAAARAKLCEGRDVAVAVIEGDRAGRIASWQRSLRWDAPAIVPYRQGDGAEVFELATFRGNRAAPDCPPR